MGLMKKLTSAIVASSLVLSLVGTAFAQYSDTTAETAGNRMVALKLLEGRANGDLALKSEITRAELVTVIVRAFGKADDAKLLQGSTVFTDIQGHWASGNIAMAKALVESMGQGDTIGVGNNRFAPDDKVTGAQAVAFLMKFLGIKADASKAWPANYLDAAVASKLITEADKATLAARLNDPAVRGLVFYLFDNAFYSYNLGAGQTFYTKYVDKIAPELTVDNKATATTNDTKVTVTGTVTGATELYVGSNKVTAAADGKFTYEYTLGTELKAYDIAVTAKDVAGNTTVKSITVTRAAGEAATVEASLAAQLIKAGTSTDLKVVVKDKAGLEIKDAKYDVTVTGEIGTFANGKFTAGAKPATGKLTVTSGAAKADVDVAVVAGDLAKIEVAGAATSKVGQALTFTAKGFDAAGNEVTLSNVSWSATKGGVINPSTGEFAGTASGNVTVTAKVGTVEGSATVAIFGDAAALALDIPTGLIANVKDTKTVSVKVVDANGAVVGNNASNVTLTVSGGKIKLVDADGNAQTQLTVKAVNGIATFKVKQAATGTNVAADFAASTTTLSAISGTLTGAVGTISSVAPSVGSVKLVTTPASGVIEATGIVSVTAKVVDTTGADMPAPAAFTVNLSAGDTTLSTLSTTALYFAQNGFAPTGPATLTLKGKEGAINLTGTTTAGYTVDAAALTTRTAGPSYQLVVTTAPADTNADEGKVTVKVAIQDASGTTKTTVNSGSFVMTAKHSDNTTTRTATATPVNGVLTFEWKAANSNLLTKAGTYTFSITTNNGLVIPANVTAAVAPGAFHHLGNMKVNGNATTVGTPAIFVADNAMNGTVTVELQDQNNNKVTGATNAVTFKRSSADVDSKNVLTGIDGTGITVNAVDGVATLNITSTIIEGTDVITVKATKADGTDFTAYEVLRAFVSTQIVGSVANVEFSSVSAAAPKAGADFDVTFKVVDANATAPRTVATDNGRTVTLEVLNSKDEVVNTLTTTTSAGLAKFKVNQTTAGTYSFKATTSINGTSKSVTETNAVAVRAANPSYVALSATLSAVEKNSTVNNNITATVKDTYGNTVETVASVVNVAAMTGLDYHVNGAVNAAILTGAGTITKNFVAPNAESAYTISDADGVASVVVTPQGGSATTYADLPVVAVTVTTYTAGPAYMLSLVEEPKAVTAGESMVVKVGVYDAAGKLKTTLNSGSVVLSTVSGYTQPESVANITENITNGVATFTISGKTAAGTYKFSAAPTVSGTYVNLSSVSVVANPGQAHAVTADALNLEANGSSVGLLTFRVVDSNNNTVTNYSGTMKFEKVSGTSAALLTSTAPIVNGKAIAQVQAGSVVGNFVVKGTVEGATFGTKFYDATVSVGSLAPASSKSTISGATAADGAMYVVLQDANGTAVLNWQTRIRQYDAVAEADITAGGYTASALGNGVYLITRHADATTLRVYAADGTTVLFTLALPIAP